MFDIRLVYVLFTIYGIGILFIGLVIGHWF